METCDICERTNETVELRQDPYEKAMGWDDLAEDKLICDACHENLTLSI